jgi:hypothetical protein
MLGLFRDQTVADQFADRYAPREAMSGSVFIDDGEELYGETNAGSC